MESITDGKFQAINFSFVIGALSAPFVWLLGVRDEDLLVIGQLLGERLVLNEFIAYERLASLSADGAISNRKSTLIATYALCGFANIASIAV